MTYLGVLPGKSVSIRFLGLVERLEERVVHPLVAYCGGASGRGEVTNIFPYEENADVVFNSSTLYDLPLLKYYAEPLLCGIAESSPAYEKARGLISFLSDVKILTPAEIAAIPSTSIMREFIGGQTL